MRDSDVRAAVLQMLHADDASTRIVQEMGVWSGSARVDIAVINGRMSGYELKSDSDTLKRLRGQVELYGRVFDCMTLVVGSKHAEKAVKLVPPWWSVLTACNIRGSLTLIMVQMGANNPAPDPQLVAQLLWRDEALAVLERYGLAKGWRSKTASVIHERLAAEVPYEDLAAEVREVLKHRADWLGQPVRHQ